MELTDILGLVTALCTTGGIIYLIVEKIFSRKQDSASADSTIISNDNDIADLYLKIDQIVESKTRPIQDKLDRALDRIDVLEENWCCWRKDCKDRIRNKKDAEIEGIDLEIKRVTCKR